jgi:copper chaperone
MSDGELNEQIYQVDGMTCEHCVAAVEQEVRAIDGAEEVTVDLDTGRLSVRGRDVGAADVRAAVEEAGYTLA